MRIAQSEGWQRSPSVYCTVPFTDGPSRTVADSQSVGSSRGTKVKMEEAGGSAASSSEARMNSWQYQGTHMGYTTELDPILFDVSPTGGSGYQKPDGRNAFLIHHSATSRYPEPRMNWIQAIDEVIGSHGPSLVRHFRTINRSLPIVEDTFFEIYNSRRKDGLDPALLCAVYLVSASSAAHNLGNVTWQQTDLTQLEDMAFQLLEGALVNPALSTLQAGLLLMQRSNVDSKLLNTQMIGAAFELGLHLDCSNWTIPPLERGLRKRLAWALYMEDQWCSLTHGRPSMISKEHWAVQDLSDDDFDEMIPSAEDEVLEEFRLGHECFAQMVILTGILSNILSTLYTQRAMQEFDAAGANATRLILERAKPIQVSLKEWFTGLSKGLKMENGQAPATIGESIQILKQCQI